MYAIVSIHDVMPDTLPQVAGFLRQLSRFPSTSIYLLVVPGCDWEPGQIRQLHAWQEDGYELAGHGWYHQADQIAGFYHRLHSRLISRAAAEHLCLSSAGIVELIQRGHDWFAANGLQSPVLYVPPAWAMGKIQYADLMRLPYRFYETQSGYWDVLTGQYWRCPLMGFEARHYWQTVVLNLLNRINRSLAGEDRPLRIALHPDDHAYRLGHTIDDSLADIKQALNYQQCIKTLANLNVWISRYPVQ